MPASRSSGNSRRIRHPARRLELHHQLSAARRSHLQQQFLYRLLGQHQPAAGSASRVLAGGRAAGAAGSHRTGRCDGCARCNVCLVVTSTPVKTRVFSLSAQSATFRVTAAPLLRKRFPSAAGAALEPVPGWATGAQAEATDSGCAGAEMRGFQAETVEYMRTGVWGAGN